MVTHAAAMTHAAVMTHAGVMTHVTVVTHVVLAVACVVFAVRAVPRWQQLQGRMLERVLVGWFYPLGGQA